MKKIIIHFLIVAICSISFNQANSQTEKPNNDFIGQWKTEDSSVKMVIFKDKDGLFQIVAWDASDGEELVIEEFSFDDKVLKTKEKMPSTDWETYNTYILVDENKIKNIIDGDGNGAIIYLIRMK